VRSSGPSTARTIITGQWEHFDMTLRAAREHEDQLRALGYLE